ncbi:hypothetical protein DXT99_24610 [Pontibacter diazotrophicus]|uniref:Uncharacterized protein n=2 Tax=Pontibacter diazotrophicus TaxID=1400979 RepID=A0A3D8L254_9BACT|nr:hypothetical protein DXT99_24610 [Pontibacter diazotrophicus]
MRVYNFKIWMPLRLACALRSTDFFAFTRFPAIYCLLLGIILLVSSCNTATLSLDPENIPEESECATRTHVMTTRGHTVLSDAELAADSLLARTFSDDALQTANLCGVAPLLRELLATSPGSVQRLLVRQRISERLDDVSLEISSTAAVLDCEEERADQIADYLLDAAQSRVKQLTFLTILLGALGTVATGIMAILKVRKKIYRSLGIAVGVMTAGLSYTGMRTSAAADVPFLHERNALGDIWHGEAESQIFPATVWHFLSRPGIRGKGQTPRREHLLNRWLSAGELGAKEEEEKQRLVDLLFGEGGIYKADELRIRANLHDQLESSVNLMKNDLQKLVWEISEVE